MLYVSFVVRSLAYMRHVNNINTCCQGPNILISSDHFTTLPYEMKKEIISKPGGGGQFRPYELLATNKI